MPEHTRATGEDSAVSGDVPSWMLIQGVPTNNARPHVPEVAPPHLVRPPWDNPDSGRQWGEPLEGQGTGARPPPEWMREPLQGEGYVPLDVEEVKRAKFAGAAGVFAGGAIADGVISGDAPPWMLIDGVPHSQVSLEVHDAPPPGRPPWLKGDEWLDRVRYKDPMLWENRAGVHTGAAHSDAAVSGDGPNWMQLQNVPRSEIPPDEPRPRHPNAPQEQHPFGTQEDLPVWLRNPTSQHPPLQHQHHQGPHGSQGYQGGMDVARLPDAHLSYQIHHQPTPPVDRTAVPGGHRPGRRHHRVFGGATEPPGSSQQEPNPAAHNVYPTQAPQDVAYPQCLRGQQGHRRVPEPVVEPEGAQTLLRYNFNPLTSRGPGDEKGSAEPGPRHGGNSSQFNQRICHTYR